MDQVKGIAKGILVGSLFLMFAPIALPILILDTIQAFLDGLNGEQRKVRIYE